LNIIGVTTLDTNSTASSVTALRATTLNPTTGEVKLNSQYGSLTLTPSSTSTGAAFTTGTSTGGFKFIGSSSDEFARISSGGIISTADITAYGTPSDIKLKENIERIPNGLEMIESLNGYTFNYIGKTDRMIGVIAQELEKIAPELVYETESLETGETSKAVRYSQITAILIEAVKELSEEIKELKKKLP
jgi:hypothetical protein